MAAMSGSDGSRGTPEVQTTKARSHSLDVETNAFSCTVELCGMRMDVNVLYGSRRDVVAGRSVRCSGTTLFTFGQQFRQARAKSAASDG